MRQETRNIYTAKELKANFPDAFERAHREYCDNQDEIPWSKEIIDSLKAVFKAANMKLTNYKIDGICGYSSLSFDGLGDAEDLTYKRAFAWLENNLFSGLRIKYSPISAKGNRFKLAEYGQHYRAGMIKPCPLTGVCFDEDFLDALRDEIKSGSTLKEAFKSLADVAGKLRKQENDYQQTEEYFLDHAESNGYEYDEDGNQI